MRVAVFLLVVLFGCKSTIEQLQEEGYTNIVPINYGSCPDSDPDRHESYRAERGGKGWEIVTCCHHHWMPIQVGKVTTIQMQHSCSRYTKEEEGQ